MRGSYANHLSSASGDNDIHPEGGTSRRRSIPQNLPDEAHDFDDKTKTSRWSPALRHAIGWILLSSTVFMWTVSNFLSSYMFADDTYNKPFFVTYCNTAIFIVFLPIILVPAALRDPNEYRQWKRDFRKFWTATPERQDWGSNYSTLRGSDETDADFRDRSLADGADHPLIEDETSRIVNSAGRSHSKPLTVAETARLGYRFCWLWFAANFSVSACFEFTSVASGTILTSLSAVFTLLIGTLMGVEEFTIPKLIGVVSSFFGILLVYATDLFGNNNDDKHRGNFPQKSFSETLTGDGLALISAAFYGYYACQIKRDCEDESRINMLLFFGFVGLFNVLFMWPFFFLFHYTGLEPFGLPESTSVAAMVVSNALISGISDMFWACAVLILSPLMVTVGLSFSIPVSLVMQLILRHQTPTWLGGVGSAIVLASVLIVESDSTIQSWWLRIRRSSIGNRIRRDSL
ncbi:Hypothetical protein R9X50_00260200 [Acrodontium crateriforme]|uniref:DUF3955 domain-containing protein n=1 Tax=Acrodontium crateriforme TaxID=150365 RepID=A0AAQ3M1J6_9PEZI|nr:Hypothetical protein R9X50_00260200 [Acrodontium crateriforme]